mgnify:CR=1 FL=1
MEELSLELTHELLDIAEADNTKELLEELLAIRGYDESNIRGGK